MLIEDDRSVQVRIEELLQRNLCIDREVEVTRAGVLDQFLKLVDGLPKRDDQAGQDPRDRNARWYLTVVEQAFDVFDRDGNGALDATELAAGLCLLCAGRADDKVRAVFALLDADGDGRLTEAEIARYLRSVHVSR